MSNSVIYQPDKVDVNLSKQVIHAAIEVHKVLGPGLLESIYEKAMCYELLQQRLSFESQYPIMVNYKGKRLGVGYRADLIVNNRLLVELKAESSITNVHMAQTLTYLKLLDFKYGLIINFNNRLLKQGIKRLTI